MKKFTLLLSLLFAIVSLQAQDYQISFAGTGASTIVGTVTVENLTQGTSLSLSGSEVLHLLGTYTGIDPMLNDNDALRIYPNPTIDNGTIEFVATASCRTNIELFDITGKRVVAVQNTLTIGTHSYQVSGLRSGIYTVRISSQAYTYTGKLVSNGAPNSAVKINYIGDSGIPATAMKLKSASSEKTMQYNDGEELYFSGLSGNYSAVITDIPTQSKTITFNFEGFTHESMVYPIVTIGDQVWMSQNFHGDKYRNGDGIYFQKDTKKFYELEYGATCWYSYEGIKDDYTWGTVYINSFSDGLIYNGYAIQDIRNIAPLGWHVPNDDDWNELLEFTGGNLFGCGFNVQLNGHLIRTGGIYCSGNGDDAYWWSCSNGLATTYLSVERSNGLFANLGYSFGTGSYVRCIKDDLVSTTSASEITSNTTICGGNISSYWGYAVTDKGVCYNTNQKPTINNNKMAMGSGTATFSNAITNLKPNTIYYVRAYAINDGVTEYGNEISFRTYTEGSKIVTDIDGNIYHTVTIGTQVWLVENLKTTRYNDGTSIALVKSSETWPNLTNYPAYCWYDNDIRNKNSYGALYNWFVVDKATVGGKNVCPIGWHVPNDYDWNTLASYLGGESVAGGKMKETGTALWLSPNTGATNETGFTALPSGNREYKYGSYSKPGYLGYWWSTDPDYTPGSPGASYRGVYYNNANLESGYYYKTEGFAVRCIKGDIPVVSTTSVSSITATSATSGGNVTNDWGAVVTARGICWNTTGNPTLSDNTTTDGSGIGSFTSNLTSLTGNTTYYIRAYATNSIGTAYGDQITFKTSTGLPIVTTSVARDITSISAICGGNITSEGEASVTERGVCYSTTQNPTIYNSIVAIGNGIGTFSNIVTDLAAYSSYFVRAYATNIYGTAYGDQITFKTSAGLATVSTSSFTSLTTISATCGGSITNDGGSSVIERGVCYNTVQNPTIGNSKIIIGSGTGAFSNTVTGLSANTTYYLRAYATNSVGTGYGSEISFKTFTGTVTDIEGNVYNTITIGTQVWMVENLKTTKYNDGKNIPNETSNYFWSNLDSPGYCWYNNDITNKNTYGALYNWYTVNTSKLCPKGWHVPTDAEWTILITFLGGESEAGGKLKETGTSHWDSPNTGATNETGFTALPAGFRLLDGTFIYVGEIGDWWSSSSVQYDQYSAYYLQLYNDKSNAYRSEFSKSNGYSVRGIKDMDANQYSGDYHCVGYRIHPTDGLRSVDAIQALVSTVDDKTVIKSGVGDYTLYNAQLEITQNVIVVAGANCYKVNVTIIDPATSSVVEGGMYSTFNGNNTHVPIPATNDVNYYNPATKKFVLNYFYNTASPRKIYEVLIKQ